MFFISTGTNREGMTLTSCELQLFLVEPRNSAGVCEGTQQEKLFIGYLERVWGFLGGEAPPW
jgi:hypothetical protein